MSDIRVRFAPSPTGPLHIGGVRTALYNYLFARKHGGTFILRIEDTDQTRFVPGAESYICEALDWLGLTPDEGPHTGGAYGPYRQSERKALYQQYAELLVEKGRAYYCFDSSEDLDERRVEDPNFKYGHQNRLSLDNSLTRTGSHLEEGMRSPDKVIRLMFPPEETITINDEIRGEVQFSTNDLDDKVILKGDGMPTYHLANIVDDHLMKISHVIRGEEWLPSTAHHVFMYESLGWQAPTFAHLPLIFKPSGQGKLSKRDGAKFGFPVFPLAWDGGADDTWPGFREEGYLPEALINFLALLGWSAKNDQELFTMQELTELFSLDGIVKSGARFDIDKALWFNQQYIINTTDVDIAKGIKEQADSLGYHLKEEQLATIASMMKERVHKLRDILTNGYYLCEKPHKFDMDTLGKKYKKENHQKYINISSIIQNPDNHNTIDALSTSIKEGIAAQELKMGEVLPLLRIAMTGTMQGPDLFETIKFLGPDESAERLTTLLDKHQ